MQRIEKYLDYRDFLNDFYKEKKSQNSFYSLRVFATQIGIDTSNVAKIIMEKRHIATKSIPVEDVFDGILDEITIANVQRSANWVKLFYMNQRVDDKLVEFK